LLGAPRHPADSKECCIATGDVIVEV